MGVIIVPSTAGWFQASLISKTTGVLLPPAISVDVITVTVAEKGGPGIRAIEDPEAEIPLTPT